MNKLRQGCFLISKIHQMKARIFDRKLKEHNIGALNQAQGRIMYFLWREDGISIQELSRRTSLEKSTLTSMLDRLEEAGHIHRVPSTEDRRKILIYVAQRESDTRKAYETVTAHMMELLYRGFDEAEIDQFEQYLQRVLHNVSQYKKENDRWKNEQNN